MGLAPAIADADRQLLAGWRSQGPPAGKQRYRRWPGQRGKSDLPGQRAHSSWGEVESTMPAGRRRRRAREVMEDIRRAAGADEVITIDRYGNLGGGARVAPHTRDGGA